MRSWPRLGKDCARFVLLNTKVLNLIEGTRPYPPQLM